jgi:hypothetical protein
MFGVPDIVNPVVDTVHGDCPVKLIDEPEPKVNVLAEPLDDTNVVVVRVNVARFNVPEFKVTVAPLKVFVLKLLARVYVLVAPASILTVPPAVVVPIVGTEPVADLIFIV